MANATGTVELAVPTTKRAIGSVTMDADGAIFAAKRLLTKIIIGTELIASDWLPARIQTLEGRDLRTPKLMQQTTIGANERLRALTSEQAWPGSNCEPPVKGHKRPHPNPS